MKKLITSGIIILLALSITCGVTISRKRVTIIDEELALKIAKELICEHDVDEDSFFMKAERKGDDWHVSYDYEKEWETYGYGLIIDYYFDVVINSKNGKIKLINIPGYKWKNGILMYDNRDLYD